MSRCHICDCRMDSNEIVYEEDYGKYKPCYTCIQESGTGTTLLSSEESGVIDFTLEEFNEILELLGIDY